MRVRRSSSRSSTPGPPGCPGDSSRVRGARIDSHLRARRINGVIVGRTPNEYGSGT